MTPDLSLDLPQGLPASTSDRLKKLAALITAGVDMPYPKPKTEAVLPTHWQALQAMRSAAPVDGDPTTAPMNDADSFSLRR